MREKDKNSVYNTKGLAPNLSMPVKGDASSTTKAAVAAGTIDIRENPKQDISALSRDTNHALNELGRIFDKQKMEERQELAKVFGEEAYRLAHNMKDDGSGRKIAVHAVIGGIMSKITGNGFASGAAGAGLNEALINAIKGQDPGTAQIVSAIIGAAAAKAVGGNAQAGASAAASGAKWNYLAEDHNSVQIGISVKSGKIGHVGIISKSDTGSYDSADYGRYGADVETSSSSLASPIGQGTVITRWFYDPKDKQTYMLNPLYVDPVQTVEVYNNWIKNNGYTQIPMDQTSKFFKEVQDSNINQNSQYYRNGKRDDYNLILNNCVTTTINPIVQGTLSKNLSPEAAATLSLLKREIEPARIKLILDMDYLLYQGKGLVTWSGYQTVQR